MGKKSNRKGNKKTTYEGNFRKKSHRWDRIFGVLTIATVALFGLILYNDFKGSDVSAYVDNTKNKTPNPTLNNKMAAHDTENNKATMFNTNEPQNAVTIQDKCVVCIDAGHGGTDKGTTFGNYAESSISLLMAQLVQKELESMGAEVVMTRTADVKVSQEQRVKIGNDKNADVFVSIHLNSSANATANGAEAWIHNKKPNDSLQLSKAILEEVTRKTGLHNRNVKYGTATDEKENYYINSHSKSTSLILELGFITNNSDMSVITSETDNIAKAIASGIGKYLNGGNRT